MNIDNSIAIVTGSAGTIGSQIAIALARSGCRLLCTDLDKQGLASTLDAVRQYAPLSEAIVADAANSRQVDEVVRKAVSRFGGVDVLVNNAATCQALGAVYEVDIDAWWREVTTNLFGPFLFSRAVLPRMIERKQGIILNMSGAGFGSPVPGASAYSCSKTALIRLTETMALEIRHREFTHKDEEAGRGIVVIALEPPFVDSKLTQGIARDPNGKRWLPQVVRSLREGDTHASDDVGVAVCEILATAGEMLSGLALAYDDNLENVARSAKLSREEGVYRLRLRVP